MAAIVCLAVCLDASAAVACPFCKALKPTLSQRRDAADAVLLGESLSDAASAEAVSLRIHKVLKGTERFKAGDELKARLDWQPKTGSLVLLFGTRDGGNQDYRWEAIGVNEASYAYAARAPSLKIPAPQRLAYFAKYLEHADPLIAEDAYFEFGHAPYDVVAQVADRLPKRAILAGLMNPEAPERQGFYGLALGLAAKPAERRETEALLRSLILTRRDDFRPGLDGILAGYMLLAGPKALDMIEARFLADPNAADGDVRHTLGALRFYFESGREIPRERLSAAIRRLLVRPSFAPEVIADLARWKDWSVVSDVAALYGKPEYPQPSTNRAVVGYLLSCPDAEASRRLADLRKSDPNGVAAAEQAVSGMVDAPRRD